MILKEAPFNSAGACRSEHSGILICRSEHSGILIRQRYTNLPEHAILLSTTSSRVQTASAQYTGYAKDNAQQPGAALAPGDLSSVFGIVLAAAVDGGAAGGEALLHGWQRLSS